MALKNKRLIASIALVLLVGIFILQNTEVVNINFLFWRFSMSRVLLIIIFLLAGFVMGWLLRGLAQHRKKHQL